MTNLTDGPDRQESRARRTGFSLVEVVVAVMILSIGVLGLAATTAVFVRQVTLGDVNTERTAALQSAVEGIRASDFDSVGSGGQTVGLYAVTWSVTDSTGRSKAVQVITDGPGLSRDSAAAVPMIGRNVLDTFNLLVLR